MEKSRGSVLRTRCRETGYSHRLGAERSRKAPPERFAGHRENPTLPRQTYTFTCTVSQTYKLTGFNCSRLRTHAEHLKSADPNGSWGFKSPSGHHRINNLGRVMSLRWDGCSDGCWSFQWLRLFFWLVQWVLLWPWPRFDQSPRVCDLVMGGRFTGIL